MVNAGLLPATVADEGLADFVARIFDNIVVHKDLAVSGPNSIAWAFRKDSSQLAAAVNGFVAQAHKGTRTGNIVLHKYLKSTKWAEKALHTEAEDRLTELVVLFQEYGDRYGFDWLMVVAHGRSDERRVGNECVSTCSSRGSPVH